MNSTSHTNFDWIGPIGDEIVELALDRYGSNRRRDLNVRFYHDYFKTHSDTHVQTEAHLHHFLGVLESDIVVPHLPYFLKVAIEYLASISRNYVFHSHSYMPVRQSNIYARLIEPMALEKIAAFGLTKSMEELERVIDEADQSCNYLHAPTR